MCSKAYKGIVLTPADFRDREWLEEIKTAGLNTLGLHSGGGLAHDVVEKLAELGSPEFRAELADFGLEWEYELHTPRNLMPSCHFEMHPEYFPEQLRSHERDINGNWCVSRPEALRIVTDNAARLRSRLPSSTDRYFYWGSDSLLYDWCNCEKCANLSPSDQNLLTSNAIASQFGADAQVCCLTYNSTIDVPRTVQPEKNVFAEFAPFHRCYKHALCDGKCAVNRKHMHYLLDLMEIFPPERIHILEYWLDSSIFGFECVPAHRSSFNKQIVQCDISFYTSLGIRSITTFAVRMDGDYCKYYGDREFLEYAEILNKAY